MDDLDVGGLLDAAGDLAMGAALAIDGDSPSPKRRRRRDRDPDGCLGCVWSLFALAIIAAGVGALAYLIVFATL